MEPVQLETEQLEVLALGGMLMGTIFGVIIVPGLYYIFASIAGNRKFFKEEHDEPLSEEIVHNE
jgi:HAE1 family hydrophobic/amphiphilic exporter-1